LLARQGTPGPIQTVYQEEAPAVRT
jgi:hypothetical protein